MDVGNIFLNMNEEGEYDRYPDGKLRVYLCVQPHERVRDAWYVERVRRTVGGEVARNAQGKAVTKDAMMVKWPEVLE